MIRTRSQWLRLLLLIVCGAATSPVAGYEAKLLDERGLEVAEPDTPGQLHITVGQAF